MNKHLIVKQRNNYDCASACLLSIMKYYGIDTSIDEVSYILKTTSEGTNALNIINGSRTFGFDGYGVHYSYDEIINNNVMLPIICHVKKNNMFHFIVLYKINKKNIEIMDPSSNIYKVNKEYFKDIYLNTSLVIFPIKEINNISKSKFLIDIIYDYFVIYKFKILKIIIYSFLTVLFGIFTNYYLLISIDYYVLNNSKYFFIVSCFFLNVFLINNILTYIRNKHLIYLTQNIYSNLTLSVIRKLFNLPYQFFKSKSTGEVESRINDIELFKSLISNLLTTISIDMIFIIVSSIILIFINKYLFLIILIEMIIYLIYILLSKNKLNNKIEHLIISNGEYNKYLNEIINSYEIDKNLNLTHKSLKIIEYKIMSLLNKMNNYELYLDKQDLIKNLIVDIGYVIAICISVIYVNKNIITLGELFLFNSIMFYFIEPIKNILSLYNDMFYLKNVIYRINDLIKIKSNNEDLSLDKIKGDIIIKDLTYSIDGINYLFEDINIKIEYRDKFLIYGKSGYGKSTIMKILLKYINEYKGNIYFNELNLKDINSNVISNSFTYVSQNSFIINDTLKNNIIYRRSVNQFEYEKILDICNLKNLRDSKLLRDNFIIEDNGFNISGGEKQKIILARSLLKDSNYIILDEALSEVDFNEEKEIIKKIFNAFEDKTIIYISHKKEIIDLFKKKYYLERRKV